MRVLFVLLSVFMGSAAMATELQTMRCEVRIIVDSAAAIVQYYDLLKTDEPHGSLTTFKLTEFDGITGLLALLPGDQAVMSLYSDKLEVGSSSYGAVADGKIAHHQLILPSPGLGMNVIQIDCQYFQ